jgi:hypothetical protein
MWPGFEKWVVNFLGRPIDCFFPWELKCLITVEHLILALAQESTKATDQGAVSNFQYTLD